MDGRTQCSVRERDPVVRHHVEANEPISAAVLTAFEQLDDGIPDDTPLYDWIDLDAVELLFRDPSGDPSVVTTIWDHRVVLTPEFVEVAVPD